MGKTIEDGIITAILVDGAFYRKRAYACYGDVSPSERAEELISYCKRHLTETIDGTKHKHTLYRIFYYDCAPAEATIYNPFTKKNIILNKTDNYKWSIEFLEELKCKRKVAIRLGNLATKQAHYNLKQKAFKKLCNGSLKFEDLTENDISLNLTQKGVDMRIGLDIASLAYKKQVNQIVLISGDSDFIPAAKLARREGIDFVLDPLGTNIKDQLFEHVDGLNTRDGAFKMPNEEEKGISQE